MGQYHYSDRPPQARRHVEPGRAAKPICSSPGSLQDHHPEYGAGYTAYADSTQAIRQRQAPSFAYRPLVRCRAHPAHRLRQSLQPAARTCRRARQGVRIRRALGAGRVPHHSPVAYRKPPLCRRSGFFGLALAFAITDVAAASDRACISAAQRRPRRRHRTLWTLVIAVAAANLWPRARPSACPAAICRSR